MPVKITIDAGGKNKQVFLQLAKINKLTEDGVRRAYYQMGKTFRKYASEKILGGPKSGRIYSRGNGHKHQASAPGEFPANDKGNLRRSLNFLVTGSEKLTFGAGGERRTKDSERVDKKTGKKKSYKSRIIYKAPYAKFLETGTPKMKPRSYLLRTIQENGAFSAQIIETEIKNQFKKL